MDGTRFAVQTQTVPIPELKGEDVRSSADFQDHGVGPGTMDGAGRNEEMVVLFGRPLVGVFVRRKCGAAGLRPLQISGHGGGIDPVLQAEINARFRSGIQQVIALVLRIDRKSTRLNSSHLGISYAV